MANPFVQLITEASLVNLAGERSYARGRAYFEAGSVLDLVQTRDAIKGRVLGNDEYRVVLGAAQGELDGSCTCPHGEEGAFCKHAVATGLAWLSRLGNGKSRPSARDGDNAGPDVDELEPLRSYLASQSREALIELLLEQAGDDPQLRAKLQATAQRETPPSGMTALKEAVHRALAVPRGFLGYRGMHTFILRADSAVDLLRALLGKGRAKEAVALADYAMRRGIVAYQSCDDSGGGFGDTLRQIAGLHFEACRSAKPDSETLAKQLFELQMLDQWGFFEFEAYARLLGRRGIARYRALAGKAWSKVPSRSPGEKRELGKDRYIVANMMETLARREGDVDGLIEVKARDLSHSHAFLEIVNILSRARRHDEALGWAERARRSFPDEFNGPLVEFLVGAYGKRRHHQDAVSVAWDHFDRHPALSSYKLLEKAGKTAGDWSALRGKALVQLRKALETRRSSQSQWHWTIGGHSLLVEIFLHEADSDAALAEARAGGCRADLWMALAKAREEKHPWDAIGIYQTRIDPIVERKNNDAYDEATQLVGKIKGLMQRTGKTTEFDAWLEQLRAKHKAKRNFMKRLERLH